MAQNSDRVKEAVKHFLDASSSLSKMSRRELEEAARALVKSATPTKERIEDAVEELRAQTRRGADHVQDMVQKELRRELDAAARRRRNELADLFEKVGGMVGDFLGRDHAEATSSNGSATAAAKTPAKKTPARKTPAKNLPARKATPKKAPVKKTPAKQTTAKQTPATKTVPKRTTAKKATAKKAAPAKATGKASGAKKAAAKRPTAGRPATGGGSPRS